ncbi:hypothetical protein ES703_28652 [subsurface metagenome]
MIVFFLFLWGIFTILAWKKGWKERALRPFVIGFVIRFFSDKLSRAGIFEWELSGTLLHSIISICLFVWLIYMTFTKPKPKVVKEGEKKGDERG